MENTTYTADKRKLLSALSHGSIFLSSLLLSVIIPLTIFFATEDPVVKENAQEALNFHLNVWAYGLFFGLLCFVLIGYPLLAILFVVHWVMPAIALMHCFKNPDQAYRYPLLVRVL